MASPLRDAWRNAEGDGRELTHGFHPWPARLHPGVARVLIERFSSVGDQILDPFCGSGTVPVDGFACGRRAIGVDINPIAISIARSRATLLDRDRRRGLEQRAAAIAKRAARRQPDPEDVPPAMRPFFDPRTWTELAAMSSEVQRLTDPVERFLLAQVLSSILVRVSRQEAETRDRNSAPPSGVATRRFAERAVELCLGIASLRQLARDNARPRLLLGDARHLPLKDAEVDLIVTSPPYLGTYDYGALQQLRARVLGLDMSGIPAIEIGTRERAKTSPAEERKRYVEDLSSALREMRRVLKDGRLAVIVIGDSSIRDSRVAADEVLHLAAKGTGMHFLASAAQERPITHHASRAAYSDRPRREHAIVFRAGETVR